ncbi:MAG: tetrapyrrole biosynthesis, uroporphyrinogen III synthase [Piptocephalis tieghemiana]|nr:MAG: tetrapyrrole biosynthesis, uroporphyrinogen III synthase [Piptocephalis tieghemiana]
MSSASNFTPRYILFRDPTTCPSNNAECGNLEHLDRYQRTFGTLGLETVNIPVLETSFQSAETFSSFLSSELDDTYAGLVITSARTVQALDRALRSKNVMADASIPCLSSRIKIPIFAVGPKTTQELENLGFPRDQIHSADHAQALAQVIIQFFSPPRAPCTMPLLFPCARDHRPELPNLLNKVGITMEEVVVYITCPRSPTDPTFLRELNEALSSPVYGLAFFSPMGVSAIAQALPELTFSSSQTWLGIQRVGAIGKTTAKAIQDLSNDLLLPSSVTLHTATSPTPQSLVEALMNPPSLED